MSMSTVVETPAPPAQNGAPAARPVETPARPRLPRALLLAPVVSISATIAAVVVSRRLRRRATEARTIGERSFAMFSGNSMTFRPVFAPQVRGQLFRGAARRGERRLFRRP
jgi:hypothetical protein